MGKYNEELDAVKMKRYTHSEIDDGDKNELINFLAGTQSFRAVSHKMMKMRKLASHLTWLYPNTPVYLDSNISDRVITHSGNRGSKFVKVARSLDRSYQVWASKYRMLNSYDDNFPKEFKTKEGKLAKVIQKRMYDNNMKLTKDELSKLSDLLSKMQNGKDLIVDVTRNFEVGEFGDSQSCFKAGGGYDYVPEFMATQEAFRSVRIYTTKQQPLGRAWIYILPENDGFVVWNAYGLSMANLCRALKGVSGIEYKLRNDFNLRGRPADIYINAGDKGFFATERKSLEYVLVVNRVYVCYSCEERIEDGNTHQVGDHIFCSSCVADLTVCSHCNEYIEDDDDAREVHIHTLDGSISSQIWCYDCAYSDASECNDCGRMFKNRYIFDNGICRECTENNYSYCYNCGTQVHNEEIYALPNDALVCEDCNYEYMEEQARLEEETEVTNE